MAGRPKGSKNKTTKEKTAKPAGAGHNSLGALNDEQIEALTRQHKEKRGRLVDDEKKTRAARMNLDKIIKAELGASGLANIKLLAKLETPEGEEEFKADMERQAMVARWAGVPVGTQGTLFEEDRRPIDERAFDEGKRAGMDGKNCEPPHQASTTPYSKWVEGWHAGQAVLGQGFKQKPVDEVIKNPDTPAGGPDDFDAASDDGAPWTDDAQIAAQKDAAAAPATA